MPSPFPGMNPYLEHPHIWNDFDKQFRADCRVAMSPFLRPKYYCRLERETFLEIRVTKTHQLVTVITMLGPQHKAISSPREQYEGRRSDLLSSNIHLIEFDLLRVGSRIEKIKLPPSDYQILRHRAGAGCRIEVWPFSLRDRIPAISVPLNHPDADFVLDLQPVLDQSYDAAGYNYHIYQRLPEPPLFDCDQAWADELLQNHRKSER